MSPYALIASGGVILFPLLVGFAAAENAATEARVSQTYIQLPLHFEANQGQVQKDVRFLSRGSGYNLYLTADEAVLVLTPQHGAQAPSESRPRAKSTALRIGLVGAARKPIVSGLEELPGKANYFIGNDRAKWRTSVPTYSAVRYGEVYPGVDLVYHGKQRQLEYDFVVAPGADPSKIELDFMGADKMEIDAQGDLVLHVGGSSIRQHKPVLYQEVDGRRQEVAGGYVRRGRHRFGFDVAAYDRSRPLVIDPVLSYSTYLGGASGAVGTGIAVDILGNAYVTGTTSADFPTTAGAFRAPGGLIDVFVTKINPSGSALVYSTVFGGSQPDLASGIDIDLFGNAYVTGSTESIDFPVTAGAFQPAHGGGEPPPQSDNPPPECFVSKLDSSGSVLVYSTYLGGTGSDRCAAIAVDLHGNALVAGTTRSTNFPTANALQPVLGGGIEDAFVTKLDPTGSSLVYSTYLGGSNPDEGTGIAVDLRGNAYITGSTQSVNFPTANAFQENLAGAVNAFVTKLDPSGSAFLYSTYLGGGNDAGFAIAVDLLGNAYVTGLTASANFPTTFGAFQTVFGGVQDAFVTKLDRTGSALVYSTYLGGSGNDEGHGVAVDLFGNAYLTGRTTGNFPTADAIQAVHGGGGFDAFVTKLNHDGSALAYSTYLGGSSFDEGRGIAVHPLGTAYVTGFTGSTNFPTANALQSTRTGAGDAFVAKIRPSPSNGSQ